MPIHTYSCPNLCGQTAEIITKSASIVVPKEVRQTCPRCKQATMFAKTVGVPAIMTPTTTASARRNDYRRKRPNAIANVLAGKTSDGRPKGKAATGGGANSDYRVGGSGITNGRWKNGALVDHVVTDSHEDWNSSYAESFDVSITEARTEKKKEVIESGTKLLS